MLLLLDNCEKQRASPKLPFWTASASILYSLVNGSFLKIYNFVTLHFNPSDRPESYGQHFIVGLSGVTLDDYDKAILGKIKPAGILLLKRNFDHTRKYPEWLELLKRLLSEVRNYVERDELIVSIDHEGGRVHRVPAPITKFPEAERYAERSKEVAKAMAIELRSLGINLSWSPLSDIHSNPANPIIGARAFGKTPEQVIQRSLEFLKSLQENGVLGCSKHYPGHGDTSTDSHLELPTLNLSEAQLRSRELLPFKAMVEAEVPFIMTAHILFPQIDPHFPATLSQKILNDILRKELGYNGIIISDDLDMKAVSDGFKREENVGNAINAGCDMFIVARNPDPATDRPLVITNYIYRCLMNRQITELRLKESFDRVSNLMKFKLPSNSVAQLSQDIFDEHAELAGELAK